MRLVLALILATTGCDFPGLGGGGGGGSDPDASVDDDGGGRDGNDIDGDPCPTFAVLSNVDRCDLPPSAGPLSVATGVLTVMDTDSAACAVLPQLDAAGPDLCVRVFDTIGIAAGAIVVVGSRPLLLVSLADVTIDGQLSASANLSVAGAGTATCVDGGAGGEGQTQTATTPPLDGGTGGGGGAFGDAGGIGARVSTGPADIPGGTPEGDASLIPLRAGCPGGSGGDIGVDDGGAAGGGGGALQLVAATTITIGAMGAVSARGGGGSGGTAQFVGGGGGGSGGGILLEAGEIIVAGAITANGGSGGEGTRRGVDGAEGVNGTLTAACAPGGGDVSAGGDGGDGGCLNTGAAPGLEGANDTDVAGSGGGGGGVGRITLRAIIRPTPTGTISPAATLTQP